MVPISLSERPLRDLPERPRAYSLLVLRDLRDTGDVFRLLVSVYRASLLFLLFINLSLSGFSGFSISIFSMVFSGDTWRNLRHLRGSNV